MLSRGRKEQNTSGAMEVKAGICLIIVDPGSPIRFAKRGVPSAHLLPASQFTKLGLVQWVRIANFLQYCLCSQITTKYHLMEINHAASGHRRTHSYGMSPDEAALENHHSILSLRMNFGLYGWRDRHIRNFRAKRGKFQDLPLPIDKSPDLPVISD